MDAVALRGTHEFECVLREADVALRVGVDGGDGREGGDEEDDVMYALHCVLLLCFDSKVTK